MKLGPTANQEAQAQLRRLRKDRERVAIANRQAVLSTVSGRAFVWEVINEVSAAFGASFAAEAAHTTAFNEGRRSVGLYLTQRLQNDYPELYLSMLQEATQAAALAATLRKQAEATPPEDDNA